MQYWGTPLGWAVNKNTENHLCSVPPPHIPDFWSPPESCELRLKHPVLKTVAKPNCLWAKWLEYKQVHQTYSSANSESEWIPMEENSQESDQANVVEFTVPRAFVLTVISKNPGGLE